MPKTPGPPKPPPSLAHATQPPVLTSWKEIAQYVGKGVRTVQRWEYDLGLPVRRTKTGKKSSVLTVPGEIDAWVQSQRLLGGPPGSQESERTMLLRTVKA